MRELRITDKLIITVATTGGLHGKKAHPKFPEQPEEIAEAVFESWNEGAAIAHIHARERDTGRPTNNPDILRDIDRRIREKNCNIIIQHSTASDFIPHLPSDKDIKAIEMNPEMATLSITWPRLAPIGGEEKFTMISMDDIESSAKNMLDRGVKPELEIYSPVVMEDIHPMIAKGILKKPYFINFVFGMRRANRGYMNFTPQMLMHLIELLPPDSLFNVTGIASQELPATALSILLGGNVRVGFEDNIYYRKGEVAESNAQLVARIARIGRELGCHIAAPSEARDILGIPHLQE
jgi:3-keto-5-aminohexanoate cleavage enzyme